MAHRRMPLVFITAIAAATAACGAGVTGTLPSATPSSALSPSPSAPTPAGQVSATLTLGNFGEADGPGISVGDAIVKPGVEPLLVNGILLKAADGIIWLCTALDTSAPPRCAEPRLLVEHWRRPPDDQTFVSGDGLHEAAGVRLVEHMQLFGVVRPTGPISSP